ncbi:hypothetical protein [Brevibacillus panacihumi]|uniref:Uncharacterized protein n=1 Tax=Brevibacillus panacihumi TaxID=497735 RepID=A0A3M8C9L3_9BACL|nr:hypothetical protein [Brevibacillus panacihumi]RNB72173.1 hypothetical protein EDM58_21970 [Brevibacillus panacihumi]
MSKEVRPKKKAPTDQWIYIGPNLSGGRLARHTVFRGSIPKYLDDLQKQPAFRDLLVPLERLSEAQSRVIQPGTAEYLAYQALSGKEKEHGN